MTAPKNDADRFVDKLSRKVAGRVARAVAETQRELARLSENDATILQALEARDRDHRGWNDGR